MAITPGTKPLKQRSYPAFRRVNGYDDDGYLVSDGKPVAESDKHQEAMFDAIFALKMHFQNRPDVYVSGNNFVHFAEEDRVFGAKSKALRDNFKTWAEGASPAVVFEFTSKETRREDLGRKRTDDEQFLKTPEYYLFDPKGESLKPRLQGMILEDGKYRDLTLDRDPRLYSPTLDLLTGYEGTSFRFYIPETGIALLSPEEEQQRADQAELQLQIERERAGAERHRAELAEAEMAKLRDGLEALKQRE